ncbi:hypothetical protein BCR33DRAFT_713654, partial [Rhizoclosmatium globosum]
MDELNETHEPLYSVKAHHSNRFTNKPGLLICQATANGSPVSVLIDSGAFPSFIRADLPFL